MVSKILILLHGSQYGHKLRREGPRRAKHTFFKVNSGLQGDTRIISKSDVTKIMVYSFCFPLYSLVEMQMLEEENALFIPPVYVGLLTFDIFTLQPAHHFIHHEWCRGDFKSSATSLEFVYNHETHKKTTKRQLGQEEGGSNKLFDKNRNLIT